MKTLICFSKIGILTLLYSGVSAHADPPSVYASRKAAEKFQAAPKSQGIASAPGADRSQMGIQTGLPVKKDAEKIPVKVTGGDGKTPLITFVAPPNVSQNESRADVSTMMTEFQNALTQAVAPGSPPISYQQWSDPNLFGAPTGETYENRNYPPANGAIPGHYCSKNDTDRLTCMACNIYFEARGESHRGQVEVGQTVMARLFSRAYADRNTTTCGIVYQHRQYSWTEDGISNALPEDPNNPALRAAVAAAREALEKGPGAYTNYFAIAGMTTGRPPGWAAPGTPCGDSLVPIGNHQFCNIQGTMNRPQSEVLAAEGGSASVPSLASDFIGTGNAAFTGQ